MKGLAVSAGNLDVVRMLVENGATVRVGDNNLRAPIQLQLSRKKADLAVLQTADNPGDRFMVRKEEE